VVKVVKGGKGKAKVVDEDQEISEDSEKLKPCTHVKVRHILCEKNSKILEAQKRLYGTYEENGVVLDAMEFSKVAEMMSEDKARHGGDLGWLARGGLDGTFQEVVFNLPVGCISEPFKSKFGWHIAKVEGRR